MLEIELLGRFNSLLFVLLFLTASFAQEYPDKQVHSLMKTGLDYLINEEFDKAETVFNKLNQSYPALPLGNVGLTAIEIVRAYDYGLPYNKSKIEQLLDSAEIKSKLLLKKNDKDIWNNYFYALTKGYYAYYQGLTGDYLSAISAGLNSLDFFEKCLNQDPNFTEAFIALGVYKYWKSRKIDFLTWLPFVKDEKEIGKEYLKKAVKKDSYSTYLAINSLVWIYNSEKKYDEAIKLAKTALAKYPGSRFFKWGLGRALEDVDKQQAIDLYIEMLDSYKSNGKGSKINEIIIKHKMAQQYSILGNDKKALELCSEILKVNNLSDYENSRLEKRLERVKELQKSLQKRN